MNYYTVSYDGDLAETIQCRVDDNIGIPNSAPLSGTEISPDIPLLVHVDRAGSDTLPDFMSPHCSWPLLSSRAVEVLQPFIDQSMQLLPVILVDDKTGERDLSYFLLNLTRCDSVFNWLFSSYSTVKSEGRKFYSVYNYTLNRFKVSGKNIFREKRFTPPLFFSETVVASIRQAELTGFSFEQVSVI